MEHANIGDIIELSNGLVLGLEFDYRDETFKTVDISNGINVTTSYRLKDLENFIIGESTWGHDTDKYKIIKIIRQEDEFQETKSEVLYIIDDALKALERSGSDNKYCVPNGSIWTYDEVREYLKKNIKK